MTASVPVVDEHHGTATVVSCTVGYEGMDPVRTYVLADTDDGRRCIATGGDAALAALALAGGLIGTDVQIEGTAIAS
jgi:hypothetical protein